MAKTGTGSTKRKTWTTTVEKHGVRIRLFERGGVIYRDVTQGRTISANGKERTAHDIRSLKHSDRALAVQQMKDLATELATGRLTGDDRSLTFGQLCTQYRVHRGPLLTPQRKQTVTSALGLLEKHLGADFPILDLDQHRVETYVASRQAGRLRSPDHRSRATVRAGTIRNELQALTAVCNWAMGFTLNGRRLLTSNPMYGLKVPTETNQQRPRLTKERYTALAAVANEVDPSGQLRLMIELAWRTGRRINAILHLNAADVLMSPDAVQRAMADAGQDEEIAKTWPGGLHWRAEWDKKGYETFSPLPSTLRPLLVAYMREQGVIGNGWLFVGGKGEPVNKARAGYLLRKAETAAGLTPQSRGGWHAFRRGWATLRKSLPVQDVMAAGGWRDPSALQMAYQGADSATVLSVVELAETA